MTGKSFSHSIQATSCPVSTSHMWPWGLSRDGGLAEFIYPFLKYGENTTPR